MTTHGDLIKNLFEYYRVGVRPTKGALAKWIEKINFIPEAKLDWIQSYFEDTYDNLPRNLPKAIIAAWYEWRRQYPQQANVRKHAPCTECDGTGIINAQWQDKDSDLLYTTFFTCSKCDNWQKHIGENLLAAHPRMTKFQIENKGFKLI